MHFYLQVALVGLLAAATSAPMLAYAGAFGAKAVPPPVSPIDRLIITQGVDQFQIVERPARIAAGTAAAPALRLGSTVHLDAVIFRSKRQVAGAVE